MRGNKREFLLLCFSQFRIVFDERRRIERIIVPHLRKGRHFIKQFI